MKTLYLDCSMGAAGDMLTAALLELLPEPEAFLRELESLQLPHVRFIRETAQKCGITGTHIRVTVEGMEEDDHVHEHHAHHHHGMGDIRHIVENLNVPEQVRQDILAVYGLIAEAESQAHGMPVDQIHFHEVGTMDAVADVTAVCMLMHHLHPDRVAASPVHVGSGTVRCAHGVLPVPAPATAWILRQVPTYGGSIRGELCTPTGAALLKHFVTEFGPQPLMQVEKIGYGLGTKDFEQANCVRAMLGTGADSGEQILELSCNVDDMTGEAVGFALETLLENGALDVYTVAVGMKKSRPGVMVCALCRPEDRDRITALLFRHTTTLGVREQSLRRSSLHRMIHPMRTPYGTVRQKESTGYGIIRRKYEYEDLAKIAREHQCSIGEILERITEI